MGTHTAGPEFERHTGADDSPTTGAWLEHLRTSTENAGGRPLPTVGEQDDRTAEVGEHVPVSLAARSSDTPDADDVARSVASLEAAGYLVVPPDEQDAVHDAQGGSTCRCYPCRVTPFEGRS